MRACSEIDMHCRGVGISGLGEKHRLILIVAERWAGSGVYAVYFAGKW